MQTDAILELMQDVATRVIDPRFRSLESVEIEEKSGPHDLVTVADREAEIEITRVLGTAYPRALMLGEEAYAADRDLLARFHDADHVFTIDPIDGTHNFVHGSPDHASMVAEFRDLQVVRTWIWQPQHRTSYVAERGGGVMCNGERLRRAAPDADSKNWRLHTTHPDMLGRSLDGLPSFRDVWWCCGVDYPKMAAGDADLLHYRHGMPWDHAPGMLFLAEIGGHLGHADGSDYLPWHPERVEGAGGLVAAADRRMYDTLVRALDHHHHHHRR